MAKRGRL